MSEPIGREIPISPVRRFVSDLVHEARKIPSVPVARVLDVSEVARARRASAVRPAWPILFMKAYALVASANPGLRRAPIGVLRRRFYEHPHSVCALAIEREFEGEAGVFVVPFRAPEHQSLERLQAELEEFRDAPLETVGFYRRMLRVSALPLPLRRFLWWSALNGSGYKRAKRLGTFGLTTYGSLGAESLHPISPLSVTLTYGPIDGEGLVTVKMVYDHRVMDGAYVARRLKDLEDALNGPILEELSESARVSDFGRGASAGTGMEVDGASRSDAGSVFSGGARSRGIPSVNYPHFPMSAGGAGVAGPGSPPSASPTVRG